MKAFSSKPELRDYLALDDHSISQFCKACEHSEDVVLSRFGSGLLHRKYMKAIDATDCGPDAVMQFSIKASDLLILIG